MIPDLTKPSLLKSHWGKPKRHELRAEEHTIVQSYSHHGLYLEPSQLSRCRSETASFWPWPPPFCIQFTSSLRRGCWRDACRCNRPLPTGHVVRSCTRDERLDPSNTQTYRASSLTILSGIMLSLGISSLFLAIMDIKHYAQIQLRPHISRDHQVRAGIPLITIPPVECLF